MNRRNLVYSLSVLVTISGVTAYAASPVIGMAISEGQLVVNNSLIDGNANLMNGSVVQTSDSPSRLHMKNGAKIVLDRNTQARVSGDQIVLEKGVSQVSSKDSYELIANGFHVVAPQLGQARVEVQNERVLVAALNGDVRVSDKNGVVLANLTPGRTLSFENAPDAGRSAMTGQIEKEGEKYVLPDEVSGLKVELSGKDLEREVGKRVRVEGTARSTEDKRSQLIEVARLNRLEASPMPMPSASPSPLPSPTPAPQGGAAAGGGLSNGAKVLIVLGAVGAVGATAGVLATQSR